MQSADDLIRLQVSHAGNQQLLELDAHSATIDSLHAELERLFSVPADVQKLLLSGGKKLGGADVGSTPLRDLLPSSAQSSPTPTKVMLIGATSSALAAVQTLDATRQAKHAAFQHYQKHKPQPVRNTTSAEDVAEREKYKFHEIRPFGHDVEQFEMRKRMLERLAEDEAIRDVMRRHKFVVGVLTELHPILQPTLLGLNKNAGEEISLRLLTDDLTGTRSYLEVRKVLCHELAHNRVSPHDDNFKTLNSLLNRQVLEYEQLHGIRTSSGPAGVEAGAWNPSGADSGLVPKGHRLGGAGEEEKRGPGPSLEWTQEEELEMRRERVRMAAEKRAAEERRA